MLASGNELIELIPQKPPMVMIDKLIFSDKQKTITGFKVTNDCIFCENGTLSESGMIENIAQTAAAGVGYVCKTENIPVPIGFIASIKDLKVFGLPTTDSEIETEVTRKDEVMGVTIIEGICRINEKILASCEMRIFLKPN